MINPILLPELRAMLAEGDDQGMLAVMTELHAATTADFSEGLDVDETWRVLDHASIQRQAEVFAYYSMPKQVEMVTGVGRERMSRLLEEMPSDDRAELLRRLDEEVVKQLLPLVAKADRHDIRMLLSFPEDSAGSIMTTEYTSLPENTPVSEAITRLRQQAPESETIYYVYVLDSERRLTGIISLRTLILAKPSTLVADIMKREPVFVRVDDDRENVARELAKYNFLAMPVVDQQNRLVGIVTHDDVMDVVIAEATEDALRMAAIGTMVENHLLAPFATVWRKRSVWLSCLFLAELMTFGAMAYFENEIAAVVALAFFVPLCISTGGNSGSQAATLITRAMALDQVRPADWWPVLRHELSMGLAMGVTLGAIAFAQVALTPQTVLGNVSRWQIALVVSQSVTLICLWGTVVGSLLPLAFRRLGFDPGYASSPFVATFVDVTGIIIYFSIARVCLL